jgi:hypothetical protein
MRTIVTLDSEYDATRDAENLISLVRRRRPGMIISALLFVGAMGFLVLRGGGLGLSLNPAALLPFGGSDLDALPVADGSESATGSVELTPTPTPTPLPAPVFERRAGYLGIVRERSVAYLPCETWGRAEDQALPTDEGPLIDYEEGLVIWCDGNRIEVPHE